MDPTLLFVSTSNPDPFFFPLLSPVATVLTPTPQGGDWRLTWVAQDFSPQGWELPQPREKRPPEQLCGARLTRGEKL